ARWPRRVLPRSTRRTEQAQGAARAACYGHGTTLSWRQGPAFHAEGPRRQAREAVTVQGQEPRRVLLSEGRHAGLYDAVVQLARRLPAVEEGQSRGRRYQSRRARQAEEVRQQVRARFPAPRRRGPRRRGG